MVAHRHAERPAAGSWQGLAPAAVVVGLMCLVLLVAAPHARIHRPSQAHCEDAAADAVWRVPVEGGWPPTGDDVHILYTSNGRPYVNYQTLVLLGSFRRARLMPGGSKMTGLTRVLHRSSDDELSPYVPTFRVDPLHPECDAPGGCPYVQADRAHAVRQYLDAIRRDPSLVRAPWLYLIETDFVFLRPVAAPGRAEDPAVRGLAFRYGNISPNARVLEPLMRRLYPPGFGPLTDLPPTGPSPVLMRVADWMRVAPRWEGYTAQIEADKDAHEKIGSVREMYAFVAAAAVERLDLQLQAPPESTLMIQPPVQDSVGAATQLHYTWRTALMWPNGTEAWRFEKRDYASPELLDTMPTIPLPPPYQEGWTTPSAAAPEGRPTTRALYDVIRLLIETINAGIEEVGGAGWRTVLDGSGAQPW